MGNCQEWRIFTGSDFSSSQKVWLGPALAPQHCYPDPGSNFSPLGSGFGGMGTTKKRLNKYIYKNIISYKFTTLNICKF